MPKDLPLVSIICVAYNHENLISRALDGFVMQKTTFPFEIIVHDDASFDKTTQIIKDYEVKYPDLFVTIFQDINQFSQKKLSIWGDITFPMARGKYIAICEGDDYWTEPCKLQNQFEFLENNDEFVICTHDASICINGEFIEKKFVNDKMASINTFCDVLGSNSFPTASIFFKNHLLSSNDLEVLRSAPVGDWILQLLLLRYGKMYYFNNDYSVYNIHENGTWSTLDESNQRTLKLLILDYIKVKFKLTHLQIKVVNQNIIGLFKNSIQLKANSNNFNFLSDFVSCYNYFKDFSQLIFLFPYTIPNKFKNTIKLFLKIS